jgi:hypothetical protein
MSKKPILVGPEAQLAIDAAIQLVHYEAGRPYDRAPVEAMRARFLALAAPNFTNKDVLTDLWRCVAFMKVPYSVDAIKTSAYALADDFYSVPNGVQPSSARLRQVRIVCAKMSSL